MTGSTQHKYLIDYLPSDEPFEDPEIFKDENGRIYFKTDIMEDIYSNASKSINYHQVADCIVTGTTTISSTACNVGNWNDNFNINDNTIKFIYNGNKTYTSTTFKTYINEQLVKTEINDVSVVFIYKALKNYSLGNETLWICFKDVYKVIDNKLVKQERIFGKVEPAKTIEETYLFD